MSRSATVMVWPGLEASRSTYSREFAQSLVDQGLTVEEFAIPRWRFGLASADALLVHWPEAAARGNHPLLRRLTFLGFLASVLIFKLRRRRVFWVFHNKVAHDAEKKFLSRYLNWFAPMVDGLLSPSNVGLREAQERYPKLRPARVAVTRIGRYDNEALASPPTQSHDNPTNTDESPEAVRPQLLAFGQLREYKGVERLIEIMAEVDADLLIAGVTQSEAYRAKLEALVTRHDNVAFDHRFVPDDELDQMLVACDGVVLTFVDNLHSAALLRARSAAVPTLTPDVGALAEYADLDEGVHLYDNPITAAAVNKFVDTKLERLPLACDELEWSHIGAVAADAIREVVNSNGAKNASI